MGILSRQLSSGALRAIETAALVGGFGSVPFLRTLPGVPLCPVKWLTGQDCPTCGVTRALFALLHGSVGEAAALNPIAFLVVLAVIRRLWLLHFAEGGLGRLLSRPMVERGTLAAFFALGWWHVLQG
ncbi:MAG TPA: DUF2752 domain-containing protein [Longimicrobium sp.]|jgi:hypothetical protein|nr:DUF2752 domain-containing protein [Longimicrobium sp.]